MRYSQSSAEYAAGSLRHMRLCTYAVRDGSFPDAAKYFP